MARALPPPLSLPTPPRRASRYVHGTRQIAAATPNYPPFQSLPLSPPPVLFSGELGWGRGGRARCLGQRRETRG
eukprot:scaffold253043_cov32-Tisochrysis_lutea.AAC.1